MKEWKILSIKATVDGDQRRVPESACVNGTGFELPCKYYTYAAKMHKEIATKKTCKRRKEFNELHTVHVFSAPLSEMGLYTGRLI